MLFMTWPLSPLELVHYILKGQQVIRMLLWLLTGVLKCANLCGCSDEVPCCVFVLWWCAPGRGAGIKKGSGSLFLPTDVCQTGILWEAALRKISLLISRLIDFFFPLKDCDACSMCRKSEAAEVEQCWSKWGREAEMEGNTSLTER